jgi:2-polyprenyl-3-methyl-5-hydroxy-6-metoxy-1,4-benzoquinol methylase
VRVVTEEIQQLYEEHDYSMLADYASLVNGIREHTDRIHKVCSLIKLIDPESLLDIGCNRGLFGGLARLNHVKLNRIVGIDISRLSCKFAKESMKYNRCYPLNASEPFDLAETFDLILCMEILEHVPSPETVIRNVVTHLRPNGIAIFSCPDELGELDGEFHVRTVSLDQLAKWVRPFLYVRDSFTLPSEFCEKPKWQGWHFVIASKQA